ncbi:MAG: hypothetical protein ABFC83_05100, partial [Synergistaceae bacterium]
ESRLPLQKAQSFRQRTKTLFLCADDGFNKSKDFSCSIISAMDQALEILFWHGTPVWHFPTSKPWMELQLCFVYER